MCTLCSVQIVKFVQIVARPECKKLGAARGVAENQVIQVVGQIFRWMRKGKFYILRFLAPDGLWWWWWWRWWWWTMIVRSYSRINDQLSSWEEESEASKFSFWGNFLVYRTNTTSYPRTISIFEEEKTFDKHQFPKTNKKGSAINILLDVHRHLSILASIHCCNPEGVIIEKSSVAFYKNICDPMFCSRTMCP